MDTLFRYLLQSAISVTVLYIIYASFLRKDTFFSVNRFFLLGAIIFSLLLPLSGFNFLLKAPDTTYSYLLQTITITPEKVNETVIQNLSVFQVMLVIYLTGVLIFSVRFIYQILQLSLLIKRYGVKRSEGMKLVFINRNYSPFSFFNFIFLNPDDIEPDNLDKILEHERVHIRQWHSIDLIILEIFTILQWFNPVVWFYRHSVKGLHEYLADEGVILKGTDVLRYQNILLQQSLGIQVNDLTNNFNHSLLKRRIIMMTKQKSLRIARLKTLLALPAILILGLIFSASVTNLAFGQSGQATKSSGETVPPPPDKNIEQAAKPVGVSQESQVFMVVENMPEFKGGQNALSKYIVENLKYPEAAKNNKIQGRVFVSFIVEKDGSVSNVKVLRGIGSGCDDEAIRVVKGMPKWTPGEQRGKKVRVQYNLPINFSLK